MKRIAVLLNGPVKNDYRVKKTLASLAKKHLVSLFYVSDDNKVDPILDKMNGVSLFPIKPKNDLITNLKKHSFFCFEYNYFLNYINDKKIDVVWANDLPMLYPGYCLAKKHNARLVYDSHEIYTETINQFFPRNKKGVKRFIFRLLIKFMRLHGKRIEQKYLPKVDHFVTVNDSLLNYFEEKYSLVKSSVIKNLPYLNNSIHREKIDYRKRFGWKKTDIILIYQGALNEGRGLWLLIDLMSSLSNNYKLVILGDGVLRNQLEIKSKQLGLEGQIQFLGFINLEELPSYTRGADIGFNLLENVNMSKAMALPNKLFEYIHAGVPVVASNTQENQQVVEKYNVGKCCGNSINEIHESIKHVYNTDYTINLEDAKKQLNWEGQEKSLLRILND